jgi:soluble lytic murein transglycosylase-like protein
MKKTYLILVLCFTLSISAFAQNRSRIFDNFDTSRGVKIVMPTVAPITYAKSNKKLVKKTVQSSASVRDAFALKDQPKAPVEYSKLVMASSVGMKGFTTGDQMYDSYIVESSRRYNIDPLLIYSQMHQESSFKLRATSNKGASGLMQLMPGTARRFGVTNIYDPKQNIEAGVKYMRWLLNTFGGDVTLALAGYNAGEGAVMKYGYQIPPYRETQEYVRRITGRYHEISNPGYVKSVRKVSATQAMKMEGKVSAPLTVYEPNAVAIRLPDGRMRLVNQ